MILPFLNPDVAHTVGQLPEDGEVLISPNAPPLTFPDPPPEELDLVTRKALLGSLLPSWAFL